MNIPKYVFLFLLLSSACASHKSAENESLTKKPYSISDSLRKKMVDTDTVLIVGHVGRMYKDPGQNDTLPPVPNILFNGHPNFSIIKKQKTITGPELDTLISILTRPIIDTTPLTKCVFDPHHTIFLIKKGKTSFIDVCFKCQQSESSTDLNSLILFDDTKWSDLENFFTQKGVRYEQQYNHPK